MKQLKRLKFQYILGYLTLFLVIILHTNYDLLISKIKVQTYQPIPATMESPWPWSEKTYIHDLIANINPQTETDIQSVANYIKSNELDPFLRIKAIHDYVITRLTYDLDVLTTGIRDPQEAKNVFQTGKAVCEGYAKLFQAIATAMGEEAVYIEGKVRREFAPDDVIPLNLKFLDPTYDWTRHAWNGVKILDNWYLVDTTWDDSEKDYRADYLIPPANMINISHLPDHEDWQLSYNPNSPEQFEEQPLLTPDFFRQKLDLLSAIQYNNQVENVGKIKLKKSNDSLEIFGVYREVQSNRMFNWGQKQTTEDFQRCDTDKNTPQEITIACQFPESGLYQVLMFSVNKANQDEDIIPLGELQFRASSSSNSQS